MEKKSKDPKPTFTAGEKPNQTDPQEKPKVVDIITYTTNAACYLLDIGGTEMVFRKDVATADEKLQKSIEATPEFQSGKIFKKL